MNRIRLGDYLMNVKKLKMYDYYYTVNEIGEVEYKLNRYEKKDLFNILTNNVFHTEEEANTQRDRMIELLDSARDKILDENLPERFVKWLRK